MKDTRAIGILLILFIATLCPAEGAQFVTIDSKDYTSLDTATEEFRNGEIKKYQFEEAKRNGYCKDSNCSFCPYLTKCQIDNNFINNCEF